MWTGSSKFQNILRLNLKKGEVIVNKKQACRILCQIIPHQSRITLMVITLIVLKINIWEKITTNLGIDRRMKTRALSTKQNQLKTFTTTKTTRASSKAKSAK